MYFAAIYNTINSFKEMNKSKANQEFHSLNEAEENLSLLLIFRNLIPDNKK